jgi:hypothetical protein
MANRKSEEEKKKAGRPRIIPQKWNNQKKEEILNSYRDGGSAIDAMCILDISRDAFYDTLGTPLENLESEEIDFTDTIKKGELLSQRWFEGKGRKGMIGAIDGFNNGAFVFQMKNRFRKGGFDGSWADKQEVDQNTSLKDPLNITFELKE